MIAPWATLIPRDQIMAAHERRRTSCDDPGFCLACGADADGVEPDAREYECEVCGEFAVFGIEELVMEIATC